MSEWQKSRKLYIDIEKLCIAVSALCIIAGLICDICVKYGIVFYRVIALNDFSMVILQIQASVGTLTIAIIALISGSITDSYMGVSISDYFLNIRPGMLKQKIIIFSSLTLILVNSICHLFSMYNSVFFLFVVSLIMVANSLVEIYSIFAGRRKTEEEIEKYYYHIIEGEFGYYKKLEMCVAFVEDWKNNTRQNEAEFDKYKKILADGVNALITYQEETCIRDVDNLCVDVAINLLSGISETEKLHGIVFVQNMYGFWWQYILRDNGKRNCFKERISLFRRVMHELIDAIDSLQAERIEKTIDLDYLLENILRIAYWIGYDEIESKQEIGYANSFARCIGPCLAKQRKKGNFVNAEYWGKILTGLYRYSYVPEELSSEYEMSKIYLQFDYCYGLILNGGTNIVKEYLYYENIANCYRIEEKQYAILVLSVHCFLYYLSRESEECVSAGIKEQVQKLLEDIRVKQIFSYFLYQLSENMIWFDEELEINITSIIERHELFPEHQNSKTLIADSIVMDFYLFIILYLSEEYYIPELPLNVLGVERYGQYVHEENVEYTKTKLRRIYRVIIQENEEGLEGKIDMMFDNLDKIIKQKYKEREINRAVEAQKIYEDEINLNELCSKIRSNTIERFEKKFRSILVDKIEAVEPIKISIFKLHNYTEGITEGFRQNFYSDMFGNFVRHIMAYLNSKKVVAVKNRWENFSNDIELMSYLTENQLELLIGSRYALANRDYKLKDEFDAFIENYICIYTTLTKNGLALKKDSLKICIHDVEVSIRPAEISDENVQYDDELKKYKYNIYSGMQLEFDKEEITEYLHNMRKIVEISIVVSIGVEGENIGDIITTEKRK